MDEYIKREDALKALQNVRDIMAESMIRHRHVPDCVKSLCEEVIDASKRVINRIPTADVVPKSESLPLDVHEALKQRAVEKAKADVAREIFAELETKAPWFCENQTAYEHFNEELAELKKKYTEGE